MQTYPEAEESGAGVADVATSSPASSHATETASVSVVSETPCDGGATVDSLSSECLSSSALTITKSLSYTTSFSVSVSQGRDLNLGSRAVHSSKKVIEASE